MWVVLVADALCFLLVPLHLAGSFRSFLWMPPCKVCITQLCFVFIYILWSPLQESSLLCLSYGCLTQGWFLLLRLHFLSLFMGQLIVFIWRACHFRVGNLFLLTVGRWLAWFVWQVAPPLPWACSHMRIKHSQTKFKCSSLLLCSIVCGLVVQLWILLVLHWAKIIACTISELWLMEQLLRHWKCLFMAITIDLFKKDLPWRSSGRGEVLPPFKVG